MIQAAFDVLPLFPLLECTARLIYLVGSDGISFETFGQYVRDDAEMILAQTGVYTGMDGIAEYSRFLGSKYMQSISRPAPQQFNFVEYDKNSKQCVFQVIFLLRNIMNPNLTNSNAELEYAGMIKIFMSFQDIIIDRAHVFLTEDLLALFFYGFLDSDNTRNFVCGVREGVCADYIEEDPPMDCGSVLASLPTLTNEVYADGNSQGCRALHATFAETNPEKHCAHLSFLPQVDKDGKLKCQVSDGIKVTDLFSDEELGAYRHFCKKNGIDPNMGHTIPQ
jgi:hypothetical protein